MRFSLAVIAFVAAGSAHAGLFSRDGERAGGPELRACRHPLTATAALLWAVPAWHDWDNSQLERWLTDHKVPNPGQFPASRQPQSPAGRAVTWLTPFSPLPIRGGTSRAAQQGAAEGSRPGKLQQGLRHVVGLVCLPLGRVLVPRGFRSNCSPPPQDRGRHQVMDGSQLARPHSDSQHKGPRHSRHPKVVRHRLPQLGGVGSPRLAGCEFAPSLWSHRNHKQSLTCRTAHTGARTRPGAEVH